MPVPARSPLALEPQPEGGYTVSSPLLPELITEGGSIPECLANGEDTFAVVSGNYEDEGCPLPAGIHANDGNGPIPIEAVVTPLAP